MYAGTADVQPDMPGSSQKAAADPEDFSSALLLTR